MPKLLVGTSCEGVFSLAPSDGERGLKRVGATLSPLRGRGVRNPQQLRDAPNKIWPAAPFWENWSSSFSPFPHSWFATCAAIAALAYCLPLQGVATASESAPLTVEGAVARSLANNQELRYYEQEIKAAKGSVKSARTLPRPELEWSAGHKSIRSAGLRDDGVVWSAAIKQPFEWPGRIALRKAIANREVELAELGLARFRRTLECKTRALAYDYSVSRRKAEAARVVADRLRSLTQTLTARDPAGLTPVLELRILEAAAVIAEHKAAEAEHDVEHLAIEINYWMGQAPDAPVRFLPAEPRFAPLPSLDTLTRTLTNHFELRIRAAELAQQGIHVELARHEQRPGFAIGPFVEVERTADRERIAGIALSIPLPVWGRDQGKIEVSESRLAQAEIGLNSARRRLESELADYWHKYEHALGVMSRWRTDSIEHFRDAAELSDRHFRLGAVPVNTYVELQRQYAEAVESLLSANQEALIAAHHIELMTGLPPLATFPPTSTSDPR